MPSDQVGACLVQLRDVLDKAAEAPVWSLDDRRLEERLGEALAVKASLDELIARLVGQVDDRDLGRQSGASSTRAHLVANYRVSTGAAAGLLAQARCMSERTDLTRQAWATGLVSGEQAVVIGGAVNKLSPQLPAEAVQAGEADLVGHAQALTHTQLQVLANHLVEVVDPELRTKRWPSSWRPTKPGRCNRPASAAAEVPTGSPATAGRCRTCSTTC